MAGDSHTPWKAAVAWTQGFASGNWYFPWGGIGACQVCTMSMQSTPCRDLFEEVRQLLLLAGPGNSYGIVLEGVSSRMEEPCSRKHVEMDDGM